MSRLVRYFKLRWHLYQAMKLVDEANKLIEKAKKTGQKAHMHVLKAKELSKESAR